MGSRRRFDNSVKAEAVIGGRVGQRDNDKRMRVEYGQVRGHVPSVVVSVRQEEK